MMLSIIVVACSGVISCTELVRIISLLPFRSSIYVRINTNVLIKAKEGALQSYKMFFHFDHKLMTFNLWLTIFPSFAIYNSFSVMFLSGQASLVCLQECQGRKCQNITNLVKRGDWLLKYVPGKSYQVTGKTDLTCFI